MPPPALAEDILAAVSQSPCRLEELVRACPDFTWNRIFLEVDRLSRAGLVRLTLQGAGIYSVCSPVSAVNNERSVEQ